MRGDTNMKTEYLESFLAVNKYKSLSKASQALFITQPTLSSRISCLETTLDVKLFERSWNGVKLTSEGMLFLDFCIQIFDTLDNFTSLVNDYKEIFKKSYLDSIDDFKKTFKIGINNYLIDEYGPVVIQTLKEHFPKLEFDIVTRSTKELKILIENDVIDYIIYYDFIPTLNNTENICNENWKILVSEKDFKQIEKDSTYLEKSNKNLYLNSNPVLDIHIPYYNEFINYYKKMNFKIVRNLQLIKLLVKEGKGYTVLPELICDKLIQSEPSLKKISLPESLPKLSILTTYSERNDEQNFHKQAKLLNQLLLHKHSHLYDIEYPHLS